MEIQEHLNLAVEEVFKNHEDDNHETQVIVLHQDGARERFPIYSGSRFIGFVETLSKAVDLTYRVDGSGFYAFHYSHDQGHKFVVVAVRNEDESAITAFKIAAHTGEVEDDLILVVDMEGFAFTRPSDWNGAEMVIKAEVSEAGYGHA